jgi:DNA repair protein RadC
MLEQENFQDIPVIRTSRDIAQYLRKRLEHEPKEVFVALYLNKKNRVLASHIIASGGIDATIADVRIILKKALEEQATSIILSHNHPSGNLRPSQRDLELTKKIMEAAKLIDVQVIDHIIVSDEGYYSFADDGILNK